MTSSHRDESLLKKRGTKQTKFPGKFPPGDNAMIPAVEASAAAVSRSSARAPNVFLTTIFLASIAIYFTALFNGFVYDDNIQIVTNRWIRNFHHLREVFSVNVAGFTSDSSTNYYRPLMYVVYIITYKIVGLHPLLYHSLNVALHACSSVMVFLIARRIPWAVSVSPGYLSVPFLSAMVFATHPVHTEAVMWVAALPDVAFSFFYLLSLYLYMIGRNGGPTSARVYAMSLVSYLTAAFFKEPAVTLPLSLLAYDFATKPRGSKLPWKLYAIYGTVASAYLIARYYALGGIAPQARYKDLTSWQIAINTLPLVGEYLRLLVLPVSLNAFHVFRPVQSLAEPKVVISLLALVLLVAGASQSYKKHRPVFLSLSLIVIPLLPAFYLPALGENPSAERYLYLPSAGFAMIIGFAFASAAGRLPRRLIATIAATLFIVYSYGTLVRSTVWKDELSLWTDTVGKSGDSAAVHKYYGYALYAHGRLGEAVQEYRTSLLMKNSDPMTHLNLGVVYSLQGLHDKAVQEYVASLTIAPSALGEVNLGLELMKEGKLDQAMQLCGSAVRRDPTLSSAHNCIGSILGNAGMYEEAARSFRSAAELDPGNRTYEENLRITTEAAVGKGR